MIYKIFKYYACMKWPHENGHPQLLDAKFFIGVFSAAGIIISYEYIEYLLVKLYCYDVLLIDEPDEFSQKPKEFFKYSDELRIWLFENNIYFHQLIGDIRRGKMRFYFITDKSAMAFKLRWS